MALLVGVVGVVGRAALFLSSDIFRRSSLLHWLWSCCVSRISRRQWCTLCYWCIRDKVGLQARVWEGEAYFKYCCSILGGRAVSTRVQNLWPPTIDRNGNMTPHGYDRVCMKFEIHLWKPIPLILSSLSSISSTDLRRHTSAISCLVRACWGLAWLDGFSPLQ